MARATSRKARIGWTIAAWLVALLIFFPILYTIITSLKTEQEAIAGFDLIPSFTLESFQTVQSQNNYWRPFTNSVILAVGSTLLALIVAIPAAWAMASMISTPGMTGSCGKCPSKCGSFEVTFLTPTQLFMGTMSRTRSTSRKG